MMKIFNDLILGGHVLRGRMSKLQGRLNEISHQSSPKCSIFLAPRTLTGPHKEPYDTLFVGIGCYYISERIVLSYQIIYLKPFLKRAEQIHMDLFSLLEFVNEKIPQILEHYSDSVQYIAPTYVGAERERRIYQVTECILINSAFLIELCRRHTYHPSQDSEYRPLSNEISKQINDILRDILLLSNQLPFFIIKELYWLVYKPCPGGSPYFTHFVCEFLGLEDRSKLEIDPDTNEAKCHHLLDLMRSYYAPSNIGTIIDVDECRKRRYIVSPTATALYEAGIKLQVAPNNNTSELLDIHFDKAKRIPTLIIPKLWTEDQTMSLFRNMIAYEQCMCFDINYINDYHYFLDCLIDTPRDVELLVCAGIIENCLGYEVLCGMFNGMSRNCKIDWQKYIYAGLSEQLNDHCKNNWNRHKATLKNKYFAHPWAMISLIYATILLLLTIIQVTTGILAVPGVLK